MAVPAGYTRVVTSGGLPGSERWSVGFYLPNGTGTAQDLAETLANSSSAYRTALNAIANINRPQVTFTRITTYRYTGGGSASEVGSAPITGLAGGSTDQAHPNQTALVTTLRTAIQTGRGRGRLYWPALALRVGDDGLVAVAGIQPVVNAMSTFLIASGAVVVSTAAGAAHPITRVDADRQLDTMNSRRRQLPTDRVVGA